MKINIPIICLLLSLVAPPLVQAEEKAATPEASPLKHCVDYLSTLPAFSTEIDMKFELANKAGKTRDGKLTGKLDFSGQDKARFQITTDDGIMELFYGPDSKFLYIAQQNQYVDGATFGDRRKALTMMPGREFSPAQIMLSDFLHGEPSLLKSMENAAIVKADGDAADAPVHVQGSSEGITVDFWIRQGETPFLEKLQLDLLKMANESNPELSKALVTYTFKNWNAAPGFAADHFTFNMPEGATKFDPRANEPEDPLKGKPAPAITLSMLGGESTLDLAAHQGKDVVILDFWASWCGPCRKSLPIVAEVAKQFKDKHVVFYAVNIGEPADVAAAFLEQVNLDIPVALDLNRDAQQKYQANSIPKMVIVGKDGVVSEVHQGLSPALKEELTATLTELTK